MNEFLLIFRRDYKTEEIQPSPESMQKHLKDWQDWLAGLADQNKLARPSQAWKGAGKIVTKDKYVTNGPFAEIKESIGGMIIIKANDYEEAAEIAKGSPVLQFNGTVEIRKALN